MAKQQVERADTDRFLRTSLLVIRHARKRYALLHPGSGVVLLTDATGAAVARRFIRGWSADTIGRWLEPLIPAAGPRLTRLVERLALIGAMESTPPRRTPRWRLRSRGSLALGYLLSGVLTVLPHLPASLVRAMLNVLPATPLVGRTVGQIAPYVVPRLEASGYAERSGDWKRQVVRGCAATSARTSVLLVLAHEASRAKIAHLASSLVDTRASEALHMALLCADGAIVVGLHSDLFPMPGAQAFGWGIPVLGVADEAATLMPFETETGLTLNAGMAAQILSIGSPMVPRRLVRHLNEGGVVHILIDAVPASSALAGPTVSFLGQALRRVDGPAWLAAMTGKPILFVGVYRNGRRTTYDLGAPMYADAALPRGRQVAELSERVYAEAEAFVRRHPEAWMGWSYLPMLLADDGAGAVTGELASSARAHGA